MASRLPLGSYRALPRFVRFTVAVVRQLERSDGLVGYTLLAQPVRKTFWTLSAWEDRAALNGFARTLPHRQIMRSLRPYMEATKFTSWDVPGSALPLSWPEAIAVLLRSSPARGPAGPPPGPGEAVR